MHSRYISCSGRVSFCLVNPVVNLQPLLMFALNMYARDSFHVRGLSCFSAVLRSSMCVVKSGGSELAERLEAEGYDWIKEELGIEDERVDANQEA